MRRSDIVELMAVDHHIIV